MLGNVDFRVEGAILVVVLKRLKAIKAKLAYAPFHLATPLYGKNF